MAKWATITTDFPGATIPAGWNPYGSYSVSGNKLRYPINGSNYAGSIYYSQDLIASEVIVRAEPGATGYCELMMSDGANARGRIQFFDGDLNLTINASTSTITYNATTHAWWRVREAGGTTYLDTSSDGLTWTNRKSGANGANLNNCNAELNAGGGSGSSQAAFSKFNLAPAPSGTNVSPSRIEGVTTIYSPSLSIGSSASPARIEAVAALYAPTPSAVTSIAPDRIEAVATLYAPSIEALGSASPERIEAVASILAPAPSIGGAVAPLRIEAVAVLPDAGVSAGGAVAPLCIEAVALMPSPSIEAGGGATALPDAILAVTSMAAPSISEGASLSAERIDAVALLYAPSIEEGYGLAPERIEATAILYAIDLSYGASVAPAAILAAVVIYAPSFGGIDPPGVHRLALALIGSGLTLTVAPSGLSLSASAVESLALENV